MWGEESSSLPSNPSGFAQLWVYGMCCWVQDRVAFLADGDVGFLPDEEGAFPGRLGTK